MDDQREQKKNSKVVLGNVCFIKDPANGKVLLLKRNREPMKNMRTGVGGKTHPEESPYDSCVREAREETGLEISGVKLRGVVRTVLEGGDSSWILSVYTADGFNGKLAVCEEGELAWVDIDKIYASDLIEFIGKIMPFILEEKVIFDGLIIHDIKGKVIRESIKAYPGTPETKLPGQLV